MGLLKKFDGSSWINSNLRKLTTDTDTFTTFPAIIYAEGTNATVGLKGNTVQSSTPTPDSPVMPQGTGDKTGNLFDKTTLENGIYLATNGNKYGDITNGVRAGVKIKALPNTAYTLSAQSSANVSMRIFEWGNGTFIKQTPKYNVSGNISLTVTTDAETTEIAFNIEGVTAQYATSIMLNTGTTALPFEPYGYKIPISSANTTTPVYLGEVQTTRKIYKYEFTGQEEWAGPSSNIFRVGISGYLRQSDYTPICTHYKGQSAVSATSELGDYSCAFLISSSGNNYFYIRDLNYDAYTDFKSYLAQQYAAGTPVTVWYVLATEETGIVNEPLMRIGNYADTVSSISIPVTTGGDTLSVSTTIQPSEVTANYYGWHTITVHERESGQ